MAEHSEQRPERNLKGVVIAGRYRIEEAIGRGHMATVYRATDVSLGRDVAVKVLDDEYGEDPDFVQRFRREAHSAAKLHHPNIVQVYEAGVEAGRCYVAMEYLPEPNLKSIIADFAPLPADKLLQVGAEVCEALEYAHNNDIVHRDLKPQNVLFAEDGRAKVADFGVVCAADADNLTQARTILGSVHYISPEQAQGNPAGPQSDIYSLGVVLYEAAAGRLPFPGESPRRVAEAHARERPRSPRMLNPDLSPSLEYIITKALAKDVARRYRGAAEMLHDLRKLQSGEELEQTGVLPTPDAPGSSAAAPTVPPRPRQPIAPRAEPTAPLRRPTVQDEGVPIRAIAVAALLAIALVVAVVYALYRKAYQGTSVRRVQVPSVIALTEAQAADALKKAGLVLGEMTEEQDDARRAGTIISQEPGYGTFVQEGDAVNIVVAVAATSPVAIVPRLHNMTEERARRALEQDDLVMGSVTQEYSDTVPAGCVIEQSRKAGSNTEKGTAIDIVISRGPQPDEVVSPPVPPGAEGALPTADNAVTSRPTPVVSIRTDEAWDNPPGQCRAEVSVRLKGEDDRPHKVRIDTMNKAGVLVPQHDSTMSVRDGEKTIPVYVPSGDTLQVRVDDRLVKEWRAPET